MERVWRMVNTKHNANCLQTPLLEQITAARINDTLLSDHKPHNAENFFWKGVCKGSDLRYTARRISAVL